MSAAERVLFEREIADHPNLSKEVDHLKALDQGLHGLGVESFKKDLSSWEQAINTKISRGYKWNNILAVAAVIILLVVPAIYHLTSNNSTSEELFLSYYQPYEEMITTRGYDDSDSLSLLLIEGMEAYNRKSYEECSQLLQSYLAHQSDARVSLYLAIAQLELDQAESAEANFKLAKQDPRFSQQAQWYQALSYLKFTDLEKAKDVLEDIVSQEGHYRNDEASKLLKELS